MKLSHLKQIVMHMQQFNHIVAAYRYGDTGIRIVFDKHNSWNFELARGDSYISIGEVSNRSKIYQAPFDVVLAKRFNRASIKTITLHNNDKILRIVAEVSGAYKSVETILQLEFTGKYTNAIVLDSEFRVIEALRHIDEMVSIRSVRVGQVLLDPPVTSFVPKEYPIEDVELFLKDEFEKRNLNKLQRLKHEKNSIIEKRLKQLVKHLTALEDEHKMALESEYLKEMGHLLLVNIDKINPYDKAITLKNFNNERVEIPLFSGINTSAGQADAYFKRSKKAKQKSIGLHQERANLEEKIRYAKLFLQTIEDAKSPEEIEMLFPPKIEKTRLKQTDSIEQFWIEGIKVSLGKNEKGNIELLKNAKAKDIWIHLKDIPSAHVIVATDKQQLPEKVLLAAAKLCVDFSVFEKGKYWVDYTPRRELKMGEGANVTYNNFKTLQITK